MKYEDIKVCVQ